MERLGKPSRLLATAFLVMGLLAAMLPAPVLGAEGVGLPTGDGLPIRIAPELRVLKVDDISDKDSMSVAEIVLDLTWKDSRLAFDAVAESRESREFLNAKATAQLEKMWHPAIAVLNQVEAPKILNSTLVIRSDGTVRLSERMAVKSRMSMRLTEYPFDRQTITWMLGSTVYGREQVALRPGSVSLPSTLVIKNWGIERPIQNAFEGPGVTGRPVSTLVQGVVVKREAYVAVTQIFLPYLAIMFMPLITLLNVGPNVPTQLFTALLALLTLNFKIVLEQPAIVSVSNSVVDSMWLGYFYIGITLLTALTIMRSPGEHPVSDIMAELRGYVKWSLPLIYLAVVAGRVMAAL